MKARAIIFLSFFSFLFLISCFHQHDWVGNYTYFEEIPAKTKEDLPLQWHYSLHLLKQGEQYVGTLSVDGYEVKKEYTCIAKAEGEVLSIQTTHPDVRQAFDLKYEEGRIRTYWKKLQPNVVQTDAIYFKKK
jgi:hypothetical protein